MTELKTLKDIFPVHNTDESYQEYDDILRAEAIKWIKHFGVVNEDFLITQGMTVRDWIKHFFNITEEELK